MVPIEKWSADEVFLWLSSIDNGELLDLAKTLKKNRIRGRVLHEIHDRELDAMHVPLGDRIHFRQCRDELIRQHTNAKSQSAHRQNDIGSKPSLQTNVSNTASSIHSHRSSHSHSNDDITYPDHGSVPSLHYSGSGRRSSHSQSMSRSLTAHRNNTTNPTLFARHHPLSRSRSIQNAVANQPAAPRSTTPSAWKDNVDDDMLTSVEESPYAAVDPKDIEGIRCSISSVFVRYART